jgi:hypothetical protein
MALFTDGPVSTIDDLSAQDSQLADVALAENIDVTRKLSLAQDELTLELTTLLTRSSFAGQSLWLGPNPPAILHAGWLSVLWLDPDPVVDCGPDALHAAEVALGGLDRRAIRKC